MDVHKFQTHWFHFTLVLAIAFGENTTVCKTDPELTCNFMNFSPCGWQTVDLSIIYGGWITFVNFKTKGSLKTAKAACATDVPHFLSIEYDFRNCDGEEVSVEVLLDYLNGRNFTSRPDICFCGSDSSYKNAINVTIDPYDIFNIEIKVGFTYRFNDHRDRSLQLNIKYDRDTTHWRTTGSSSPTTTTTTDATTYVPTTSQSDNLSRIIIIGASAGGAFIVLLVVVILLLICWRRRMLCCKPHHNQPNSKTRSPQTRDHTVAYTMWRVDPGGNEGQSNGIANRGFDPESPAPETAETGLSTPVEHKQAGATYAKQAGATYAVKTETVLFAPVKTQQTGANGAEKTETEVQETEIPDYAVVKKKTKKQAAARYDYTNVTKPKPNIHQGGGMKLVLPKPEPKSQNAEETIEENKKTSTEAETNALIPKSPNLTSTKKFPLLPTDTKGPTSKQKGPAGVLSKDKGPAGVLSKGPAGAVKDKGPAGVLSKDTGPGSNLNEDTQNVPKSPPPVAKKPQVAVKPFRPGNIKVPVLPSDHKLPNRIDHTDLDPVLQKPEQEHENEKSNKSNHPSSSQEQTKATKSNKPQPSSEQKQESQGKPPKVALLPPTMKGKNKNGQANRQQDPSYIQATPKANEQLIGQSDHAKSGEVAGVTSKDGNSPNQQEQAAEHRNANISAQEKLESNGDKGKLDSVGGSSPDPVVTPQDRLSGILDDKGQFYFILDKETHEPVAVEDGENSYAVEDDANYAYTAEESENYSEIDSHQNHPTKDEMKQNPDRNQNRAGSYYEIADPLLSGETRPESATYSSIDDAPAELGHSAKEDSSDGYYSIADMPSKVAATSEDTAKRDLCYSLATVIAEDNELSTPDDVGGKEDYNYLNFDGKNGAAVHVRKDEEGGEQVYSHLNAGVDEDVYSHTERDVRKVEVIDDDYSHINIQQQ